MVYLTTIPWAHVGYEMIDREIIETPPKYRKPDYNKNKKAKKKNTHTLSIFVDHGIIAHTPWWLSQWNYRIALSNDPVFNNSHYTVIYKNGERMRDFLGLFIFIIV